jgi:hypothetical protein
VSAYPNVPTLWTPDGHRKNAQALNHLLNQQDYIQIEAAGVPDAGQTLFSGKFPFPVTLVPGSCGLEADVAATNAASFALDVDGVSIGSITVPAVGTVGIFSITTTRIPAWGRLTILAPNPQDPSLADITLSLAII